MDHLISRLLAGEPNDHSGTYPAVFDVQLPTVCTYVLSGDGQA